MSPQPSHESTRHATEDRHPVDAWRQLTLRASAEAGRRVEVLPSGQYAYATMGADKRFSTIYLPEALVARERRMLVDGLLAHEILHARESDPTAFRGLSTAAHITANALEDLRVERQSELDRRGDVEAIRPLLYGQVMERLAATQERTMASTLETMKVWEVAFSLYLLLWDIPREVVKRILPRMSTAVAEELLPIAFVALRARTSQEVVALAHRLLAQMARAAQKAAAKQGTAAATQWANSFTSELRTAQSTPADVVLATLERRSYPAQWFGPWLRGGGGYSFATADWDWPDSDASLCALDRWTLEALLNEVDPIHFAFAHVDRFRSGTLLPTSHALVRARVGGDRRVFARTESRFEAPILRSLLAQTDVHVIVDAHGQYPDERFAKVKDVAASLCRLFDSAARPATWTLSAHHTSRTRETVENPVTKRQSDRWSHQFFCNVALLKSRAGVWEVAERRLGSLVPQGFNQPFEAYPRLLERLSKDGEAPKTRTSLTLLVGDLTEFNVYAGYLASATECLRGRAKRVIYVHVGRRLPAHYAVLREMSRAVDGVAQVNSSLQAGILEVLQSILLALARERR
jgi:hypothetical protein